MMNRRGMLRAHSHWRPSAPAAQDPQTIADTVTAEDPGAIEQLPPDEPIVDEEVLVEDEPQLLEESPRRPARWPIVAVLLAIALGAYALGSQPSSTPASTSTARAWLHTYMSSSTRSPGRVCTQLLTPTLARLFAQAHGSCETAYRGVKSAPFSVLRVLQNGSTAAIELHWLPNVGYSTIVLNRDAGGWRAVDMIPGGHIVPHR
jgi:hypothetical protein